MGVLHAKFNGKACGWGHNARAQGVGFFRTRDRRGIRGSGKIRLAAPKIMSGRVGGFEAALRALHQGNVDVGVLQEKKLTNEIHVQQK